MPQILKRFIAFNGISEEDATSYFRFGHIIPFFKDYIFTEISNSITILTQDRGLINPSKLKQVFTFQRAVEDIRQYKTFRDYETNFFDFFNQQLNLLTNYIVEYNYTIAAFLLGLSQSVNLSWYLKKTQELINKQKDLNNIAICNLCAILYPEQSSMYGKNTYMNADKMKEVLFKHGVSNTDVQKTIKLIFNVDVDCNDWSIPK